MSGRKNKGVWEFGDFQTPEELAFAVVQLVRRLDFEPTCILEPTCGQGTFLVAAASVFPAARQLIGIDINASHLAVAYERLKMVPGAERITLRHSDFFEVEWDHVFSSCRGTWLILGNPPWVTSSELGMLGSTNLPAKSNFHGWVGLEAMMGKSNFDISEWMLLRYLEWLHEYTGVIAVLCKMSVARKILTHAWKRNYPIKSARLYTINASRHFNAAVDACLFILEATPDGASQHCDVYSSLDAFSPSSCLGYQCGVAISDTTTFQQWIHLLGQEQHYIWRSGIKHDCAKVMELRIDDRGFRNGFGAAADVEPAFLFPLLKSSDIGNGKTNVRRYMLVTQQMIGEDTTRIKVQAPRTWKYLQDHAALFHKRSSSVYRNRPPFSIFGVGNYSFAPWKVAISGFYKRLTFVKVAPLGNRPIVFDDTVYFLPCRSEEEADFLCMLLNSKAAQEFYESMIFWSDKRPITIDLLKRLNLKTLASELGQSATYVKLTGQGDTEDL